MILEYTPTIIRLKVIQRTTGPPNVEKVQTLEAWDFISKDQWSKVVAVRHACFLHWFSQPFMVKGKMTTGITTKQKEGFGAWTEWVRKATNKETFKKQVKPVKMKVNKLLQRMSGKAEEKETKVATPPVKRLVTPVVKKS